MPQKWIVYVDETGSFDPGDAPSYVVGWMTRVDHVGRISELEDQLQELAPWLPRPLHTTYLRQPAWHGVCLLQHKDRQTPSWLAALELSSKTLDTLRAELAVTWENRDAYTRAVDAMNNGREPAYEDLRALGKDVPRNARALLQQIASTTTANLRQNIETFNRPLGPHGGIAVLGGQSSSSDNKIGDPYLTTLAALVRAATWTLLERLEDGESATLEFAVAGRYVTMPDLLVRAPLSSPTLNAVIRTALNDQRSFSLVGAQVEVQGGQVHDFKRTPLTGIFVADFVANSVYRLLNGRRNKPLHCLNSDVYRLTGMFMRFGDQHPYGASATGWGFQDLENTLRDVASFPAPERTYQWVKDATSQWRQRFRTPAWKEALQ